ncbi:MAG: hypothetical protein FJZ01_20365 [Candidatus Sericytochromatia bacterium]|nr:hypothetical protein [Candidatus Tanganyikabacteria bacterium]
MRIFATTTAVACLLALAPAAFGAERKVVRSKPSRFELSAGEWASIAKGEIVVRHANRGQINEFFSAGYVKAAVDDVFWYYEDHTKTMRYQNAIRGVAVEEDNSPRRGSGGQGGYRRLRYDLQLPWPVGTRKFVLDLEGHGEAGGWGDIHWSKNESGDCGCAADIAEMMGSYVVTPYPPNRKWSLVRYWVKADMNTWIPGWLVGFVQGGTIPHVVAQARKDLESPALVRTRATAEN